MGRSVPLPTFVIVGAQKCGTSTLTATLRRHPQVFMARPKELHFFTRRFDQGIESYAASFTPKPRHRAWGETTPLYLYDAAARHRMCSTLPEAKLVVILRDPVKRAYSHYWHARRTGNETRETFEQGLAAEPERLAHGTWRQRMQLSYVDRGHYVDQLESLTSLHPRSLIHVVLLDDLINDRERTLRALFEFLDVDPSNAETIEEKWTNRYRVRSPAGKTVPVAYPPMASGTRDHLADHFRPHNEKLATWLGRDLSAWT